MTTTDVVRLLAEEYGARSWQCHRDPLSELILTILSQNTSDANSDRAFAQLEAAFGSWERAAAGSVDQIAQAIRCGGLARVKAARIKLILEQILTERGSLDLAFLGELPLPEAKSWLLNLPGVGPKTAGCVLLFSLGWPVLPVDTHVHRVAKRLGLIGFRVTAEQAHEILGALIPQQDIYQFHLNMVAHGRRVCQALHPRCYQCILREGCPTNPEIHLAGEGCVPKQFTNSGSAMKG